LPGVPVGLDKVGLKATLEEMPAAEFPDFDLPWSLESVILMKGSSLP